MKYQRKIELLAPAKNLECGIEAINHGADAVYIGAPKFSARSAAGNSLEEIATLTEYAHRYGARIYIALNTILDDRELEEANRTAWELYRVGVDALIIQDVGLLQTSLPPLPLHASTQMDNRDAAKVSFLSQVGFDQVVLARELSLEEIAEIHRQTDVALEVFVHGALCVSYSGQCYISQACFGRSANRGECAQFCRLPFNLTDAHGAIIRQNKHLLSLKDMNRSNDLEGLLDAGVTSFKIEGRLKEVSYVKNITAFYRKQLDAILKRRPEYARSSSGKCSYTFTPQLNKSFSRGSTSYFLHGRSPNITSFDTPKSLGEEMGRVKEIRGNYISVAGIKPFNNGDGVCFIDERDKLTGFRVNRVESNRLYPQEMPRIKPKTVLYRNFDQEFERIMGRKSAERKIGVESILTENAFGFTLTMRDEDDNSVSLSLPCEKELARSPQRDNQLSQLTKLGNTPFAADKVEICLSENWFIPTSALGELRRKATDRLLQVRLMRHRARPSKPQQATADTALYPHTSLSYLANARNKRAREFYLQHGVKEVAPAFEQEAPAGVPLMFCKHCLRYSMGWCPTHQKESSPYQEPFYLSTNDGKRFRLKFDCKKCEMQVVEAL